MIPDIPGLKVCSQCSAKLIDEDFSQFGVTTVTPSSVFFDYQCNHCGFKGKYLLGLQDDLINDPLNALKVLVKFLSYYEDDDQVGQRVNTAEILSKIHGVSDLLKLGGKNAPKEPRARRPNS